MFVVFAKELELPGGQKIFDPLLGKFPNLASVVTQALDKLVFPIAGIILFLYLMWGGFDYMTAMGDPKKAEAGKNKITNGVIGFVIIFAAYWIVQVLDYVFKFKVYSQ